MRCIYCLEIDRPSKGRAHIFPESLRQNVDTLAFGAVCDRCNEYLGQLDRVVASHPLTSLAIQFLGLPGKRGRKRDRIGNVDRTIHNGAITIPCEEPELVLDGGPGRSYRVRPLTPPTFDMLRFRRGLHHIAFNLVAAMNGVESVLEPRYDRARNYIRRPGIKESWEYGQYIVSLERVDKAMFGGIYDNEHEEFVALRLFNVAFFVDLHASGNLKDFLRDAQPPGTDLIAAEWRPSKPVLGAKQYRFSIYLD
jgi:hypothetical protein